MSRTDEIREMVVSAGDWLHGGNIENTVAYWNETNLTVSEIEDWVEAGCFDAGSAFQLSNAGLLPSQVAEQYEGRSLGYWYSNGDMSLGGVIYRVENSCQ